MLPLVLVVMLVGASPQERPDFSGTWTTVSPVLAMGEPLVIRQDESEITLTHGASGHGQHATTYRLNGEPLKSELASHGTRIPTTKRGQWEGTTLVLTHAWTVRDSSTVATQRLSLDEQGRLRVDTIESGPGRMVQKTAMVLTRVAVGK